jgi:hypothetical protein
MIPTIDDPLRSTEIEVGNSAELVGKVFVEVRTPAAVTFQIVTACKFPTKLAGGTEALSGFTGVGTGLGGFKPKAKGVAPVIQISPAESTAAAVAIDVAD